MDLRAFIEVRPPYLALSDMCVSTSGSVSASVVPEQPLGHELGGLAAAEAGRHMAIAGSCACASLEPSAGKRFYLANRAILRRHSHASSLDGPLTVKATAISRDKRRAQAEAAIADSQGSTIFTLEVGYTVLEERVFQRMFSAQRRDMRKHDRPTIGPFEHLRKNPYLEPLSLVTTELDCNAGVALLPELKSEMCSGHFPMYPAMPVALLMWGLSSLCGAVLRVRCGEKQRYFVESGTVQADSLIFAGESLRFEARWLCSEAACDSFEARAVLASGAVAGCMQLVLRSVESTR